ncbi:polycystic kidney disease protein 1-like 3 [Perognathus longimembris pacificus]|uniref:polycystic kidney disease protein 1-like 3 n=1 Tax=Perognathus longimembris pacificus TaxID=214514 RepID=UPI002018B9B6|nr:polycystic kidney disease protein 1-like 3 [Perognathus longimembris pacificus]
MSAPSSPPWSTKMELSSPTPATLSTRPQADMAASPGGDVQPGVSPAPPQGSAPHTSRQVGGEPAGNWSGALGELKEACQLLQNLRDFAPSFSSPAQAPVVNLLVDLSEQTLQVPSQSGGTPGSQTPATLCHFPPLSVMNGVGEKQQTPKQDTEQPSPSPAPGLPPPPCVQVEDMLETALLALGTIQDKFLWQSPGSTSSVTLTSSLASVLLSSSLNTSTGRFTVTVNITSVERSLLVAIEPASPLFLTLYLGFEQPPDHTHFLLSTTLPQSSARHKDEDYTWVLTPESLQYRTGTYYITVILNENTEPAWQTPILVSVVTALTQCYFWDKNNRTWKSNGCQVGLQSSVVKTQCLCDHLTFFGSDFFVVPRTVRVEDTAALFRHVSNNPVGVLLLASLLGLYLLLGVWAWRKDQQDLQKLPGGDPHGAPPEGGLLRSGNVSLQTASARPAGGSRRATRAEVGDISCLIVEVVVTLYGSKRQSEPRHLWDPQKKAFGRGALDVFLLGTRDPLGDLHALRLWLHHSGGRPSWYISQVIVSDMASKKKWHFLCNCWLATDLGDFQCDRVFMPASRAELFSFRHLFSSTLVERFTQDHPWLSVATRHPWNPFTRLQRLTCCTTLLLCDMVINIMFWRLEGPAATRDAHSTAVPAWVWAVAWDASTFASRLEIEL